MILRAQPAEESFLPPVWLSFAFAVPVALFLLYRLGTFYHDDAFIILRYAQNLMAGHGPVWNPGEHVEGYTSLLWLLGSATLGWVGLDLVTASRLLGVSSLVCLLLVLPLAERRAGAAASAILAGTGPMIAWSVGGLETVGFALLATAGLLAGGRMLDGGQAAGPSGRGNAVAGEARSALTAGVLLGIAELCRPEATLFAGVLLLQLGWRWLRGVRGSFTALLAAGSGFAAVFVPRLVWRIWYYGELLPNTYYVKAGSGLADLVPGADYVLRFALFVPVASLLVGITLASRLWRRFTPGETFLLWCLALYTVHVVRVGGDHMQWFRFFVPMIPTIAVLGMRRLRVIAASLPAGGLLRPAPIALCILGLAATLFTGTFKNWERPDPAARYGEAVGRWIGENWKSSSLVALNTAGSSAFYGRCRFIDMLGLNDSHIAHRVMPPTPADLPWANKPGHRKGDGAYVLSRRPDYIILGGSAGEPVSKPWFVGDREIVESPGFLADYEMREVQIPETGDLPAVRFRYFEIRAGSRASG